MGQGVVVVSPSTQVTTDSPSHQVLPETQRASASVSSGVGALTWAAGSGVGDAQATQISAMPQRERAVFMVLLGCTL